MWWETLGSVTDDPKNAVCGAGLCNMAVGILTCVIILYLHKKFLLRSVMIFLVLGLDVVIQCLIIISILLTTLFLYVNSIPFFLQQEVRYACRLGC